MGRGGSIVDEFTSQFGRSPADPLGAEPDSLGVCANRPLGEAWVFVGSYEPEGTVFAHGQILSIVTYSSLYSLVGTSYGGNGQTTFGVPDLRGIEPQGLNYVICVFGVFPPQN
jgi:microcystin-dependent protein